MYLGICLIALTGEYTGESEAGFFAYYAFFLLNMFNAARLLNKLEAERKKSNRRHTVTKKGTARRCLPPPLWGGAGGEV
jgi:hypothetical protein